jgi:hypothetical protein
MQNYNDGHFRRHLGRAVEIILYHYPPFGDGRSWRVRCESPDCNAEDNYADEQKSGNRNHDPDKIAQAPRRRPDRAAV